MKKVIPAMQRGEHTEVTAIASRNLDKARRAASALNIPRAYGSYEELLADPEVDAIYNPLPNHLHVPWTARAAEAGKHVLCEKPIAMNAAEARTLLAVRDRTRVKIGEAFMIRSYPQWLRVRELLDQGRLGELRAVTGTFSYFNVDPANIRNLVEFGGGALMDIGCYLVHASRFAFKRQPLRVVAAIDRDPAMRPAMRPAAGIDRLTSGLMDFGDGHAVFTCGTQLIPYQKIHFMGTRGRIEIEIPFNAPPDRATRIVVDSSGDLSGSGIVSETFPASDQYTMQGEAFAKAVWEETDPPVSLEDAIGNMEVIDALFQSASSSQWITPGT